MKLKEDCPKCQSMESIEVESWSNSVVQCDKCNHLFEQDWDYGNDGDSFIVTLYPIEIK